METANHWPRIFRSSSVRRKNLLWKTPIHDQGWSSPVARGKQIWLTTGRTHGSELFAICADLDTGKIVQDIKVFDVANPQLEYQDMNLNTHATPPPIVEAGRVYVHYTVDHRPLLHCGVKIRSRNMVIYMAAS